MEKKLFVVSVAKMARYVHAELVRRRGKARARVLDLEDILVALARHAKERNERIGGTVMTVVEAGAVCKAYKWRAETDRVEIVSEPDGGTRWYVGRVWARSVPYGGDSVNVTRVRR